MYSFRYVKQTLFYVTKWRERYTHDIAGTLTHLSPWLIEKADKSYTYRGSEQQIEYSGLNWHLWNIASNVDRIYILSSVHEWNTYGSWSSAVLKQTWSCLQMGTLHKIQLYNQ